MKNDDVETIQKQKGRYTRWSQIDGRTLAQALYEHEKNRSAVKPNHVRLFGVLAVAYLNTKRRAVYLNTERRPDSTHYGFVVSISKTMHCSRDTTKSHLEVLHKLCIRRSWAEEIFRQRLQCLRVTLKEFEVRSSRKAEMEQTLSTARIV